MKSTELRMVNLKPSELRIGNFVTYITDSSLVKISATDLMLLERNPYSFEPIPLTPEILEKAGFESVYNNEDWTFNDIALCFTLPEKKMRLGGSSDDDRNIFIDIKYLHQLQNLMYSLTGEELEIKL